MTRRRQQLVLELTNSQLLNLNQRIPRHEKAVRNRQLRELARTLAGPLRSYPATDRVRVLAVVQFATAQGRDVGNWSLTLKPIVDGLVLAGVLADDDDRYVVGPDLRRGPGIADPRPVPLKRHRFTVALELAEPDCERCAWPAPLHGPACTGA